MIFNFEELQKIKDRELEILKEFDRVCKTLNCSYTISSGTLLGAVRHKGFIPWDDDIDVAMLRDDYDEFLSGGQSLLPEHLFIQTYEMDKNSPHNFAKIRDTSTSLKEYGTRKIDMKHGVYIDIFPIDNVSRSRLIRFMDNWVLSVIYAIKLSCTLEFAIKASSYPKKVIRLMLLPLSKLIGIQRLNKLETLIRTKDNRGGNYLTYADRFSLIPYKLKDFMLMPISIFENLGEIEFENHKFKAIKDWDTYLSIMYGDYMQLPPEHKRTSHNFIEVEI